MFPAAVLAISLAQAPQPQASLAWVRSSDSIACDVNALRHAVALRLGYDPFVVGAPLAVKVSLSGTTTITAHVTVDRPGAPPAQRSLSGPADCRELTDALALALCVAIDPLSITRPAPAPPAPLATPAPQEPALPPTVPAPVPAPPPAPPSEPLHFSAAVSAALELGSQPGGLFEPRLSARVGGRHWAVLLEAFADVPSAVSIAGGGSIGAFSVGGTLGPCAQVSVVSACLLLRGGALRYEGRGLDVTETGWLPSFAGTARVAVEWPLDSWIAGFVSAELSVPIAHARLLVGDSTAWEQPLLQGGVALGVLLRAR